MLSDVFMASLVLMLMLFNYINVEKAIESDSKNYPIHTSLT